MSGEANGTLTDEPEILTEALGTVRDCTSVPSDLKTLIVPVPAIIPSEKPICRGELAPTFPDPVTGLRVEIVGAVVSATLLAEEVTATLSMEILGRLPAVPVEEL